MLHDLSLLTAGLVLGWLTMDAASWLARKVVSSKAGILNAEGMRRAAISSPGEGADQAARRGIGIRHFTRPSHWTEGL